MTINKYLETANKFAYPTNYVTKKQLHKWLLDVRLAIRKTLRSTMTVWTFWAIQVTLAVL